MKWVPSNTTLLTKEAKTKLTDVFNDVVATVKKLFDA